MAKLTFRLLLVEDDPEDARSIRKRLAECPLAVFTVDHVPDLPAAGSLIRKNSFDMVLLDLSLPESRGSETFERMSSMAPADLPVILLTGNEDHDLAAGLLAKGAQDYILKTHLHAESLGRAIMSGIQRGKILRDIRLRETRFFNLLENSPDAVLLTDADGKVVFQNAASRLFFEGSDKMIGDVFKIAPGGEIEVVSPGSGKTRIGELTTRQTSWEGENVNIINIRDITERKRLAKESHHLQRLEGLGVLAGGIAHDFNNVLTGILGNISIARITADPGSKVQEALLNAEKSCQVAGGLVQKLLPFAHSGSPVKALVPMKIFIRESLRSYEFPPSIQLRFSLEDDLWDAELDGGQVKSVLISLVDNSVHACPEGGVIELAGKNVIVGEGGPGNLAPGPYVRLTITDTGRGIAEEDRERIFDPYFTTKDGSNGLGLAVAFSVLKRHSGSITVRSLPGSGAAFDLSLPAKAEIEQESSPVSDRVGERKGSRAGKGRKSVLIMDDEKDILETAGQMIAVMGNSVSTARDGEEAISRYRESLDEGRPFDAVILDLRVPGGMGGRETMEKLRVIDPGVTAVVSSGYSGDPIMSEYGRYGFKAAVAKPYSSDDLKRVLEKVLEE